MNSLLSYVIVFCGAGLGGMLRHAVNGIGMRMGTTFPWSTLFVNVTGCLVMGVLAGWFPFRGEGSGQAWRDVWIGAGMTAILFTLGKFLLGLYLGREGVTSPYGAAGSLVLVLLWVYYSGLIFLFGAAFTKVHAASHDAAVRPTAKAVAKESPWEPARQHGTEPGQAPSSRHNQGRYRNGTMSDPSPPLPK